MKPLYLILCLLLTLLPAQGWAGEVVENQLAPHFTSRGVEGCFVVHDVNTDTLHVWNPERAKQRFRPASTFKVPNAVIGLETRAVKSIDEVIPYGGTKELNPDWEQDMNLRDAMRVSNVAVFHQLAKREGLEVIKRYLTEFAYGNSEVGGDIQRRFWLEGPLEISAIEQVAFLRKLGAAELPIRQQTGDSIRELILFQSTGNCKIYAKTGWVGPKDPQVGWWVGWVQKGQAVYPFALNIDIHNSKDAKLRIPIGLDCLASLGMTSPQPLHAAEGSQPFNSVTNREPLAAGSHR